MSECSLPSASLVAYADGTLSATERKKIEDHIHGCPSCQRALAEFAAVDTLLRDATPPLDDPAGRAAIKAQVAPLTSKQQQSFFSRLLARLRHWS